MLFLSSITVLQAKELYFKPYVRYHLPLITQNAPIYFNRLYFPQDEMRSFTIPSDIAHFSLSQGFKYGATFGYTFNDVLGVELSGDYFSTNKTFSSSTSSMNSSLDWKLNSWNIIPSFTFSKKYGKSSVIAKIGVVVGTTGLEKSVRTNETPLLSYRFDRNISLGYAISFEYNFMLSDKLALAAECGIENSSYTPTKAELTDYYTKDLPLDVYPLSLRTIKYENTVRGQGMDFYNSYLPTIYSTDQQNEPQTRIKETLKMNSLYFGISIKYYIFKK
jgi:hypothetical protein